ncbi:Alpha/Beta hydrolase protein [Aspergillus oleicola]
MLSISSLTSLFTTLPTPLIPPTIFLSLLLTLWTWKCLWIIILQDKLLYLSWLPPLSRSESIDDYKKEFRGVRWTEKEIRSLDGMRLAVVEGRYGLSKEVEEGNGERNELRRRIKKRIIICYLQGNGGSTPLRLPLLSQTLKAIEEHARSDFSTGSRPEAEAEYILVALSYRGYWKSKGRATQSGIEKDAQALLDWVHESYNEPNTVLRVVLWGHSLGAAVASSAVVKRFSSSVSTSVTEGTEKGIMEPPITGLILEAPISNIKDMLVSLYPQKWLPYRYLWPFSWNTWDVASSLEQLAQHREPLPTQSSSRGHRPIPPILLMSAESDEVIPEWVADQLEDKAKSCGLDIARKDVKGAMHIECPLKVEGRKVLVEFIVGSISSSPRIK